MVDMNWAPVGVVLAVVTGIASLATLDLQTVTVVAAAFVSGVLVGRESLRRSPRRSADGGQCE